MSRRNLVVVLALAAAAVLAVPAAALAQPRTAVIRDKVGDAPDPQLDIRVAGIAYDPRTGVMAGSVTLGAPPTIAVVDSITFSLGRFGVGFGARCDWREDVTITIPDADDVAAGLPLPFAELFPPGDGSQAPVGFLPTSVDGGRINFSSAEANNAVVAAIRSGRWNCVDIQANHADTFETADGEDGIPLVAGPRPRCSPAAKRVRAGRPFRLRCRNVSGPVTVRVYKERSSTVLTARTRIRKGRLAVATIRDMRGGKRVFSVWKGDVVVSRFHASVL